MKKNYIQSILIPRDKFTLPEAIQWIIHHKYKLFYSNKFPDITTHYYRFRQNDIDPYYEYRTITFGKGIKAIYAIKL